MPVRSTKRSAGYDFFNNTGFDIMLEPGEISNLIPLGVKSYMQFDEYLTIVPRSSLGKYSTRLANSIGIIDCVPGDSLISTPDGDFTILEILDKKIMTVYSFNEETNEIEEDFLTNIMEVEGQCMMLIQAEDGSTIKLPETKEVYTKRGWVVARDLSLSDEILAIK